MELGDELVEGTGLGPQLFAARRQFLATRRVRLGNLRHRLNRPKHLKTPEKASLAVLPFWLAPLT